MKLYPDTAITYTQEYFLQRLPDSQRMFIRTALALIVTAIIFISVAEFEEVVKVSGFIRPKENISSVSNAVAGRIENISYKSGQEVKKGQMLLKIDPTWLEAERDVLLFQIAEEERRLEALEEIRKSNLKNINIIDENHQEASLRYDLWRTNLKKLENIKNLNYGKFIQEKKLPPDMTTASKIRELESQYIVSCNEYENLNISFRHEIEIEIDSLKASEKINRARLTQTENSLLLTEIIAPIDGTVQEISALNRNDWIQAGQQILNIIPDNSGTIKTELMVPARQAGKIFGGLKVRMRFPGLSYNEFGGVHGTIITVAPDSTKKQNGDAFFIIETDLDRQSLSDRNGKTYPLKIGLYADARIIVSKKTILKFILEKMNLWH